MSAAAQYGADLQASHRRMAYGWIYPMGVVNVLLYAVQLAANQLAATGTLFGKSVGDVSALNETRLTPAGYAFSIWFVIYVLLLLFVLRFFVRARRLASIEYLFALSCLLNTAWVIVWVYEKVEIACGILAVLWLNLFAIWVILYMTKQDWIRTGRYPALDFLTVFAPFSLYFGWTCAAFVVNISVILPIQPLSLSACIALLATLGGVSIVLITISSDILYAAAVMWALAAIVVKSIDRGDDDAELLAIICFVALAGLVLGVIVSLFSRLCIKGRSWPSPSFYMSGHGPLVFSSNHSMS